MAMPIDFTLTPEQQRLRGHARAFARDVLSTVAAPTQDPPTPLARFGATEPFYLETILIKRLFGFGLHSRVL